MKHSRQWFLVSLVSFGVGGSGSALSGCAGEEGDNRNPHYVAAETALKNGCGSRTNVCHAQGGEAAMFDIGAALDQGDIRTAMVNVPACEYDVMDIVEPGDPDNSWLMVKITGDFIDSPGSMTHGDLQFTPAASWSETDKCNPAIRGFGKRMPNVSPFEIDPGFLESIRTWIELGAPGPNDP